MSSGLLFFAIGATLDNFQVDGNMLRDMNELIICVSGEHMISGMSLMYLAGMLSPPVETSVERFLKYFITSS